MITITQRKGVGGDPELFTIMRRAELGGYEPAVGQYAGQEPLSCVLWAGDARAQAATLPCSWANAAGGVVRVEFPSTVTSILDVGWYEALVTLPPSSVAVVEFRLVVDPGPGLDPKPPAYHTYTDLTNRLPLVGRLNNSGKDQGGFADVAGMAREWIDGLVLDAASSIPAQTSTSYPYYGSCCDGAQTRQDVADALAAGRLITTGPNGRRIVQASVCYALGVILERSAGLEGDSPLIDMGRRYADEAKDIMSKGTFEIADADDPAKVQYRIEIGRVRVRRA